jgi:hypothetical protein
LKAKFESNQIKNTGVIHQNFFQKVVLFYTFLVVQLKKKKIKSTFSHRNFLILLPLDPDPDSHYGSGSTNSLNPDPDPQPWTKDIASAPVCLENTYMLYYFKNYFSFNLEKCANTNFKNYNSRFKGVVSRKLHKLFLYHSKAWKFLNIFYFIHCLKYRCFHVEFSNIRHSAVSFY